MNLPLACQSRVIGFTRIARYELKSEVVLVNDLQLDKDSHSHYLYDEVISV